jgi:hypothetical protein
MRAVSKSVDEFLSDGVELFVVEDFDGVVNTFYRNGTMPKRFFADQTRRYSSAAGIKYLLQFSRELVENLNKLYEDSRVQVLFLTTWRGHMQSVVDVLERTFAREPLFMNWGSDDDQFDQTKKYEAFNNFFHSEKFYESSAKAIWVDDYVLSPQGLRDAGRVSPFDYDEFYSKVLTIAPCEDFGISRENWAEIEEYARKTLDTKNDI